MLLSHPAFTFPVLNEFELKLLLIAAVFCLVAIVLDAIRSVITHVVRDRPHGFINGLAWATTTMVLDAAAPQTVFSKVAWSALPLVFLGWFAWSYGTWLRSRNPSIAEQWRVARKTMRILVRAQLTPQAVVLDLMRVSRCLGRHLE